MAQAGITKLPAACTCRYARDASRQTRPNGSSGRPCSQTLCFNFSRIQESFLEPKMKFSLV